VSGQEMGAALSAKVILKMKAAGIAANSSVVNKEERVARRGR